MNWKRVAWVGLVLALVGCHPTIRVNSSYDHSVAFEQYRTYAMMLPNKAVQTPPGTDPFVMKRLREVTYALLKARGLQPVAPEQADLLVGVLSGTKTRVDVTPRSSVGYGYYGYGYPPGWGYDVWQYDEGTIVVDLIDRRKEAVVWRGTGTRVVNSDTTEAEMQEVVAEILQRYPPGSGDE